MGMKLRNYKMTDGLEWIPFDVYAEFANLYRDYCNHDVLKRLATIPLFRLKSVIHCNVKLIRFQTPSA